MKKYLLAAMAGLALISCEEEDDKPTGPSPYPTDNLTLKAEVTPLAIQVYQRGNPAQAVYEITRLMVKPEVEEFHTISTSLASDDPFNVDISQNLIFNYDAGLTGPDVIVGNTVLATPVELLDAIDESYDEANDKDPIVSMGHEVTNSDTAWTVDVKLKFQEDTSGANMYIQTYMLADVPAIKYEALDLDLRFTDIPDFIEEGDSMSYWVNNVLGADSSTIVAEANSTFMHPDIILSADRMDTPWGTQVSEYWTFGPGFTKGDVLGTRYTPIRHNFNKEDIYDDFEFMFAPKFLTVIWIQNPQSASFEYYNSVVTELEMEERIEEE